MRKTLWWRALVARVERTGCGSDDELTTVSRWAYRRDIRTWWCFTLCLLSFGWAGCGSGGSGSATLTEAIAGPYNEYYNCKWADGTCADVNVLINMDVTGPDANGDYTIEDLGGSATAIGRPTAGNRLTWTSTDPNFGGFIENGTWEFDFSDNPTTFVKHSTFSQPDAQLGTRKGVCTGSGVAGNGTPALPPPYLDGKACTPQP